jgi:hypothetical protein
MNLSHEQRKIGATYLRYHIRMYVETFQFLELNLSSPHSWDTHRNATLESHLIHARALINFVCKARDRKDDILAMSYFHDLPPNFSTVNDGFLSKQSNDIGGLLVHITTKAIPKLKSEQEWPIMEIAIKLRDLLESFFYNVPDDCFPEDVKKDCLELLNKFRPHISVYVSATT